MLNSELIWELQQFNPDAEVSLIDSEDICLSYISENGESKQTTERIFIEGADICQTCTFFDDGYCIPYEKNADEVKDCYNYQREVD